MHNWGLAAYLLLSCALNFLLFLLPGFSLVFATSLSRRLSPVYLVIGVVTTGAVLGYCSFWAYFFNRHAGDAFTFVLYSLVLFFMVKSLRRNTGAIRALRYVALPLLLTVFAAIGYLALLNITNAGYHFAAWFPQTRFFVQTRPGDNMIPEFFADKLYTQSALRPFCCGDWLTSDRPPLQTGIFLLFHPFYKWIGHRPFQYQALGTVLQCFWISGIWCLLVSLGTPARRIRQIIILLMLSGFLFYNSVYVWPKLLAATFVLFAISIIVQVLRSRRPITVLETLLGAGSFAMAMLAHPGSAFSLLAFVLLIFVNLKLFSGRRILLAVCVLAAALLPWSAYQKFVDPPGNRLLKLHLAGVGGIDQRSFVEALRDSYRAHSWAEIWSFKQRNLRTLLGKKPLDTFGVVPFFHTRDKITQMAELENSRIAQREYIWNAIGLLNLGWLVLVVYFVSARKLFQSVVPFSGWIVAAAIVNLLAWCLIYFGPGGTYTTHSSYADILLLEIALAGSLLALPTPAAFAILLLQLFNLLTVWVFFTPGAEAVQKPFAATALIFLCASLVIFAWDTKPVLFARRQFRNYRTELQPHNENAAAS